MPRMPAFTALQPACSVHLQIFPTHIYMDEPAFDVGVQYDDAVWPGAQARSLLPEHCVVVCAPQARYRREMARGDFRSATLLQLSSRLGAWEEWFAQAEIARTPANTVAGHRFDLFSMLVEAVRAGLGVGLVPDYFVERELRSGELVPAHPKLGHSDRGYSVFTAPHKAQDPVVDAFVRWLRDVAAPADAMVSAHAAP